VDMTEMFHEAAAFNCSAICTQWNPEHAAHEYDEDDKMTPKYINHMFKGSAMQDDIDTCKENWLPQETQRMLRAEADSTKPHIYSDNTVLI